MDLTTIIAATITAIGGVLITKFLDAWQQARRGRLDQAQKIAAERDAERLENARLYTLKRRWSDATYNHRTAWSHYAITHQTPPPVFPPTPDDDPR